MSRITCHFPADRTRGRAVRGFLAFALLVLAVPAFAQPFQDPVQGLARVGPVTSLHGYPDWYQDKTGITLEFCQPLSQGELDGGYCLLLPGDTTVPEQFPGTFSEEHFYWAANATAGSATYGDALLVLGLEGAFAAGAVKAGDQIVFGRLRLRYDVLVAGTYTFYTPYGTFVFPNQSAGTRIFETFDIGFPCPSQFDCALASHVGPFLLAANTPGGAELPSHVFEGRSYVADPARLGPVTGSPLAPFTGSDGVEYNHNVFRVEGPIDPATGRQIVLHTQDFALMGRLFTGSVGGEVKDRRATYAVSADLAKLDVFATAFAPITPRLPGGLVQPAATPVLAFFAQPCAVAGGQPAAPAAARIPMASAEPLAYFWGQTTGARAQLPASVCLEDATARNVGGATVATYSDVAVSDQVTIAEATYDPTARSLTVLATSSDPLATLSVAEVSGAVVGGSFTLSPLNAPPSRVTVNSLFGGRADLAVSTGVAPVTPPPPAGPVANDDSYSLQEDAPATLLNVLGNDTLNAPAGASIVVTVTAAPGLGDAVANADGSITYTPRLNQFGTDSLQYRVSVNGVASNTAQVLIAIAPVNDPPVAVADSFNAVVNVPFALAVLANDTDVDNALSGVIVVTPPSGPGTASATAAGTLVSFTASAAGLYTFTYRAVDAAGAQSAPATVSVNVTANQETITITSAQYRIRQDRWGVSGTSSLLADQILEIYHRLNGVDTLLGFAQVTATGAWTFDVRGTGITAVAGSSQVRVTNPVTGASAILSVTVRS